METKIITDSLIGAETQRIKLVFGDLFDARKVLWSSGNELDFKEDGLEINQIVKGFKIKSPKKDPNGVRLGIWINSNYKAEKILPALSRPLIKVYLMEYLPILLFKEGDEIPEEVEALILGNLYRDCSYFLESIIDFPEIKRNNRDNKFECLLDSEIKYKIQFKNLRNNSGEEYFAKKTNTYQIDLNTELSDSDITWVLFHEVVHLFRDRWNFFTYDKYDIPRNKLMPELIEYLYKIFYNRITI